MFTTADLPKDMQYDPDREARQSGLTIACEHGDPHCGPCIRAAVARLTTGAR